MISDKAQKCPKCGYQTEEYKQQQQMLIEWSNKVQKQRKKNLIQVIIVVLSPILLGLIIALVSALVTNSH